MTIEISMTNICFVEAIKLGHGNEDQLGNYGGHAPTMEIVLVFKVWTIRLRMDVTSRLYETGPAYIWQLF